MLYETRSGSYESHVKIGTGTNTICSVFLRVRSLAASLANRHREWSEATLGSGKRISRALVYRAPVFKLNITPVTLRPTGGAVPGGG